MTVDEFKMIAKQYGYDFNPLYENLGQLRIHIDNIWTEDKMLVVYNGRIQVYNPIFYRDVDVIATEHKCSKIIYDKQEFIDWLDEVTARIQMYKRMIKVKQIKSITDGETID